MRELLSRKKIECQVSSMENGLKLCTIFSKLCEFNVNLRQPQKREVTVQ